MSSNVLSYGNGLPSDYLGIITPRDTYVQPVALPLYEPVGQPGGELNEDQLYISTLAVSSIQGEFLNNNVDMSKVNLTVSTLLGGSNGTLSTIGSLNFANASTSLVGFQNTNFGFGGLELQGQIFFGTSSLSVQFSNQTYSQTISWTASSADPIANNNAILITTGLDGTANPLSTPITAVQKTTQPYNSFTLYGQSNAPFAWMVVHLDQPVV